ncbi:hypothetical protein TWF481_002294 [Arthrobotrys musiformis]|uniref:Uncharacterized protein n=1 Tax=Arthrobotrys musiformis TaxID=47236 RepID=A0AAV9VSU9_9PEZI
MRAAQIIRHARQNGWRFRQPNRAPGQATTLAGFRTPYLPTLKFECPFIRGIHTQTILRYNEGVTNYESRKRADSSKLEPGHEPALDANVDSVKVVPSTREPTPPPYPGKNPRTFYSWMEIEPPKNELGENKTPILNTTLTREIEGKLLAATREAISLPEEEHQAHYKKAYEEVAKDSRYEVPITDPPSETIGIVAVDELWSENCRWCPCACEDDLPYIQIHGSIENGGKGVTFKMIVEEMGDWLYGDNAEEIIEGERGRVGLTVLTFLEHGTQSEADGLLDSRLYWYVNKAEKGIQIGW